MIRLDKIRVIVISIQNYNLYDHFKKVSCKILWAELICVFQNLELDNPGRFILSQTYIVPFIQLRRLGRLGNLERISNVERNM